MSYDPFANGLDAIFNAPGSMAADYAIAGSDDETKPIRVILSRPDQTNPFGGGQIISGTAMIDIRRSEVANPRPNDVVRVGTRDEDGVLAIDQIYQLTDEPVSDVEAMTWSCGAQEIEQ